MSTTAATILPVDLGKFNSVLCWVRSGDAKLDLRHRSTRDRE